MRDSVKLSLFALIAVAICAIFIGKGLTPDNYQFFLSRRIPKVLAIILAAMAIASSSLVFQTITSNRILTPSILGFDSLYVMIQVILVATFGGVSAYIMDSKLNFVLSTSVMVLSAMVLFHFYFRNQRRNIFTLLLVGVVLSSLFGSVTSFFTMVIDPDEFSYIQGSMFASFNSVNNELVYWSIIPLSLALAYLYKLSRLLDVLWLGVDNATSLGINTHRLIMKVMFVVTIMVSISTALVGPVLFFGLIVVALTRQIFNHFQHQFLLTASIVLSIMMLLGGQWIVEGLFDFNTTISVIINFLGGGYFLYLLARNKFD
ncbi:iron chelate uptake ABC transporter family permease subunit [Vibrio sp. D404a]|uniref:iron chelate uptake ABC transporter family permease subunit n=1 Tax=unclassified Vibrio TaxID=2614977 RepID=UPI0025573DFC|nr:MULTISPECIES: iron chelate uptake ABC transporter family permease subunit [unclassified Vibrio]MDK9735750.1 iron chelate uptake ABC transporter family permease subunit [Vibrio sp. D404a]MDK9798666.1 iron chelate uptake ABC transporter family permease subunit [Vibrio sp. D449a]